MWRVVAERQALPASGYALMPIYVVLFGHRLIPQHGGNGLRSQPLDDPDDNPQDKHHNEGFHQGVGGGEKEEGVHHTGPTYGPLMRSWIAQPRA